MKNSKLDIRALRVRPVCVPMRLPLQTATGIVDIAPLVLLDLETTAGITGRSYLFAVNRLFLKPLVALCETMGEMVKGDPVAPFDLEKKLRQKHTLLGVHNIVLFAMAGIDMAAWDAYAQSLGQPLVKVLGGTPRPIKAYNSKGLGIMPLKPLAKEAEALVNDLLAMVPEPFTCFTNGDWAEVFGEASPQTNGFSFDPLTESALDAGIVCARGRWALGHQFVLSCHFHHGSA